MVSLSPDPLLLLHHFLGLYSRLGVTLLVFKIRRRKDAVPFGPFLAGAALVSLFWGQDILDWYRGLFPI